MKSIKKIAVVGCVHGDEIMGKLVINELKKNPALKQKLAFFVANEPALAKRKRCLKKDLNRVFPGKKKGLAEERIAYFLYRQLRSFDLVIDLHATNSNFKSLAVVTKFNQPIKNLLKIIPIDKVALIKKSVFGGREMIGHCKLGLALEFGPNKSGKNYPRTLAVVKTILKNLNILPGQKSFYSKKELYTVAGSYKVPDNFKATAGLKDFSLIKKNQVTGHVGRQVVKSNKNFYPIFLGKGRYQGTLALVSNKKTVSL